MPIFHKTRVCNKASLSPINEPFLSFNTNQKPRIKSPKSGDLQNKNYIGHSPDPIFSRPNIKEKIAVWLRETKENTLHSFHARFSIQFLKQKYSFQITNQVQNQVVFKSRMRNSLCQTPRHHGLHFQPSHLVFLSF